MNLKTVFIFLIVMGSLALAANITTVFNPFTSKLDYITNESWITGLGSSYVPYTNASGNVNLSTKNLTAGYVNSTRITFQVNNSNYITANASCIIINGSTSSLFIC